MLGVRGVVILLFVGNVDFVLGESKSSYAAPSTARLSCYVGRSSEDRAPYKSYPCPGMAQFCYKSILPHKSWKYEWGCANSIGCKKPGCEHIYAKLLKERVVACCCRTNLCNASPPSTHSFLALPLLLTSLTAFHHCLTFLDS